MQRSRPVMPTVPLPSLPALRTSNGDHGGCACVPPRRSNRKRSPGCHPRLRSMRYEAHSHNPAARQRRLTASFQVGGDLLLPRWGVALITRCVGGRLMRSKPRRPQTGPMTSGGSQYTPCLDSSGRRGVPLRCVRPPWSSRGARLDVEPSCPNTPVAPVSGRGPPESIPTYAPHRETRRFVGGSSGCLLRLESCY
jgi:hypothetical protein